MSARRGQTNKVRIMPNFRFTFEGKVMVQAGTKEEAEQKARSIIPIEMEELTCKNCGEEYSDYGLYKGHLTRCTVEHVVLSDLRKKVIEVIKEWKASLVNSKSKYNGNSISGDAVDFWWMPNRNGDGTIYLRFEMVQGSLFVSCNDLRPSLSEEFKIAV